MVRTKQLWKFYYVSYLHPNEVTVHTMECKQPSRTKIWKSLQQLLSTDDNIKGVGYTNSIH